MFGARQVGEFMPQRRMIRGVKNPMDKATIVSIYPKDIVEVKETLQPNTFMIKGGKVENPGITVIDPAAWWLDTDPERPMTEIPVSAVSMAHSLITDYCNGLLGCNMTDRMPGIFYVAGELSQKQILEQYKLKINQVNAWQRAWYQELIRLADALWARHNGNPMVIWDEMKHAAEELGADKPWLKNFQIATLVKCFACGALRNPEFPICPQCKTIDPTHPRAKEVKTAV